MSAPEQPQIYHIVHVDRLKSIIQDGFIWCDTKVLARQSPGTTIGMPKIKRQRQAKPLRSASHLMISECVPFNFCPRSVMLYVLYVADQCRAGQPELSYYDGQEPIIHLRSDMRKAVTWAEAEGLHWAFTTENAAAASAEDYANWSRLSRVRWEAVKARDWKNCRGPKQAEFLIQDRFPWELISQIGVCTQEARERTLNVLQSVSDRTPCAVEPDWYY